MENEFDYYFIRGSFKGGSVPRLVGDDATERSATTFMSIYREAPAGYITHLTIGPPVPDKPDMEVDILPLRGNWRVFSRKICDALAQYDFKGLQLVPAEIRVNGDEIYEGFHVANIYRKLPMFDPEKTVFDEIDEFSGSWEGIEKIMLDREKLSALPLEERLVFVSEEHPGFILYHKTVVDAIMSANPEGIIFIPVEEWSNAY